VSPAFEYEIIIEKVEL